MTLITPDLVTDACLTVLRGRHNEHLAAFERQRGLEPQTIEPLATVDLLAGEGFRLRDDTPPAALLGVFGTSERPKPGKNGLTFPWTLAVEITVLGQDRADTLKRRDWYVMTVAECLLARVPRHAEPIDSLTLADIELVNGEESSQRTVGEARLIFDVVVRDALVPQAWPVDDSELEPGSPGGPPADTYTPPVPLPAVQRATTTTTKEHL